MKHLIKTTETYVLSNENDVEKFLDTLKDDPLFELSKYSSTKKVIKEKGEIIDEYIKLDITRVFNQEKEPCKKVEIKFEEDSPYAID